MRKKFDEQFKAMVALEAVKEELTLQSWPKSTSPPEPDQRLETKAPRIVISAF